MCNFSNNQSQSATSTNNTTPSAIELIKMVAELAAIDHASAGLYSPIPINANFNVNIGDLNISCSIINNAARDIDKKQATTQTTQQESSKATSTTTSNQQQKPQETQTTTQYQQKITEFNQQQLPEKFRRLYYLIADFLGSYSQVKINIAPGCETDSVRISFINKGESTGAENMFFGVTSIPTQRYFRQQFEHFSVFPGGDAFSVTIKGCEVELSKLITKIEAEIKENKRNVKWARYNY